MTRAKQDEIRGDGAGKYTCNDYRQEMILAALQRQLQQPNLGEERRRRLLREIERLEAEMGL